jgi:hypothetical protein
MSNAFEKLNNAQEQKTKTKTKSSFDSGTANKGGRPAKSANDKRNSKVTVYFSSSEQDALFKYCDSIGMQPAVFLRNQALNKIKDDN